MPTKPPATYVLDTSNSLTSGLINYWPLLEGFSTATHDYGSAANNGTLTSTGLWDTGPDGSVITTSGVSTYVDVGTVAVPATFTLMASFNTAGGYVVPLFSNITSGSGIDIFIYAHNLWCQINGSAASVQANAIGSNVDDGAWHTVFVTANGSGINFYIDSSTAWGSVGSGSIVNTSSNNQAYLSHSADGPYGMTGSMNQVAIWSRVVSTSEMAALLTAPYVMLKVSGGGGSSSTDKGGAFFHIG